MWHQLTDVNKDNSTIAHDRNQPIAIVGIGCRFPNGANDVAAFWKLLSEGADCTTPTEDRFYDASRYYNPIKKMPGRMYNRCCGYLTTPVDHFDRKFFNMSPTEASHMDPQGIGKHTCLL